MKSDINCLVCGGNYFVPCDLDVTYYRMSEEMAHYGSFESYSDTAEVDASVQTNYKLGIETPDGFNNLHVYACEDCGFVMPFMKSRKIISRGEISKQEEILEKERKMREQEEERARKAQEQEEERKRKLASMITWSDFPQGNSSNP